LAIEDVMQHPLFDDFSMPTTITAGANADAGLIHE